MPGNRFAQIIIIPLFCFLLLSCTEKPQDPFRVGCVLWPGYEPLKLAERQHFFDNDAIRIIDYLANSDAMLAFQNKMLEAGAFTLDETLQMLSHGIDIQVVLIMDISHGGDVILANPGIESVEDLKGKRVAVETTAVGSFVLSRALELHGLTFDDITVVPMHAVEQKGSFARGEIDAAVSFDPHRTPLVEAGKKQIFDSTEIPGEIVDVLVVRSSVARDRPEAVRQLVQGWFRALEYQRQHPRKAIQFSSSRFDITPDEYLQALKLMRFPDVEENIRMLSPETSKMVQNTHKMIEPLARIGVDASQVRIEQHLNADFIR